MGCVGFSSIVFLDAMYDDMVLSRSACGSQRTRVSIKDRRLTQSMGRTRLDCSVHTLRIITARAQSWC